MKTDYKKEKLMRKTKAELVELIHEHEGYLNTNPAVYTQEQMEDMMRVTRSWTLNNPIGPLPYLPVKYCWWATLEENIKAIKEHAAEDKKPHWIIKLLINLKVFKKS